MDVEMIPGSRKDAIRVITYKIFDVLVKIHHEDGEVPHGMPV
jgi:hypothetical protein